MKRVFDGIAGVRGALVLAALTVAIGVSVSLAGAADENAGSISGNVTSKAERTFVRVVDIPTQKDCGSTEVTSDGSFKISNIPPGNYSLLFLAFRGKSMYWEMPVDPEIEEDKNNPLTEEEKEKALKVIDQMIEGVKSGNAKLTLSCYSKNCAKLPGYDAGTNTKFWTERGPNLSRAFLLGRKSFIAGNSKTVAVLHHYEYKSEARPSMMGDYGEVIGDAIYYLTREPEGWKTVRRKTLFPDYRMGGIADVKYVFDKKLACINITAGANVTDLKHTITIIK